MRMKSNLQLVKEYSDYRHAFLDSVEKLIEQYDVTDVVVTYSGGTGGGHFGLFPPYYGDGYPQ